MIKLKHILTESFEFDRAELNQLHDDILDRASDVAAAFGETIKYDIGEGGFGTAYELNSGRVLKITTDASETTTAMRRKDVYPHIASYADVRVIIADERVYEDPEGAMFALLTNYYTPLNPMQIRTFDRLHDSGYWGDWTGDDLRYYTDRWRDMLTREIFDDPKFAAQALMQRDSIIKAMRRKNIGKQEAHSGNIGFDKHGRITLFDMWTTHDSSNINLIQRREKSDLIKRLRKIELYDTIYTTDGIDTPDSDM